MRIVLIGAGSVEFTRNLLGDILSYPELSDAEIVLHDIDADRLRTAERMAAYVAGRSVRRHGSRPISSGGRHSPGRTSSSTPSRSVAPRRRRSTSRSRLATACATRSTTPSTSVA